jgi:dTDP-4-amino-4,6-dideoxygalactose transaminase
MTDVIAGIGIIQMKRYKSLLKKRQKIVDRYNTKLNSFNIDIYQRNRNDRVSSNHIYIVRLLDFSLQQRNEFIKKMGEVEIACNVHYKPLPMFSGYQKLGFNIKDYPNAFHLYENEVTLPLHTLLKNKDVERIIKSFGKIYNEIKNEKVE